MEKQSVNSVPLANVMIDDHYWNRYINLISDKVIPYQWEVLNDRVLDAAPSYCLQNFRIAAGDIDGERKGTVFQDTDVAKWLEAVSYSLATKPNKKLEQIADDVVDLIGRAQCKDGYLNTYYTLVEGEERWSNIMAGHELYSAGHFIEAAVAYYKSTGKRQLLDILCRFADLINETVGPGENQLHFYPGHPEIELALVKLYKATGEQKYLELAKYFVETRGSKPNYFLEEEKRPNFNPIFDEFKNYSPVYSQSHVPVLEQDTAEGHAVRAVYLYCAMADLAQIYSDKQMLAQCEKLWSSITQKRMYITGGIGSSGLLERFTIDYDLPNDCNYSETCASIGLAQFGLRMARIKKDAGYIDIVERTLYNNIRAGIAMTGDRYFYVNPLEVWPDACMSHTSRQHVKPVRQKWFDVACCPTNIARTFTALGQYIYFANKNELFINLFVQNKAKIDIAGEQAAIDMQTDFPKSGNITINISSDAIFDIFIRVPTYAKNYIVKIDGKDANGTTENGYYKLNSANISGFITITFDIKAEIVHANPLVRANCGKIAILRGPEVYCLEEIDNGKNLAAVFVDSDAKLTESWREDLFGGTMIISLEGYKLQADNETNSICISPPQQIPVKLTAIPYGSWQNRDEGEMIVWLHSN